MKKVLLIIFAVMSCTMFAERSVIDSLQNELNNTDKSILKIELLFELAKEYVEIDTITSLEYCDQALQLSDKMRDYHGRTISYKGYIYNLLGNSEEALTLLSQALYQFDTSEDRTLKAEIYKNIGNIYAELQDHTKSLEFLNKALIIYNEIDSILDQSILHYLIGNAYEDQDNYKQALENYLITLDLDEELNDRSEMAIMNYIIGGIYNNLSEYVKALESYYKSLALYEELNDKDGIADSYNAIGNIFQTIEEYDTALEYYHKHLDIQKELGNKSEFSISYNNIGIIWDDKKDYDKSLDYYLKALEIDEELKNQEGIGTIKNNIGIVLWKKKEYNKAIQYLQQSLVISKDLNDIWATANTLTNFAEVYISMKQYSKAFTYLDEGFQYAVDIDARDLILESYKIYSKLHSKTNNFQKALEYFKDYTCLKDTLCTTSVRKIAAIQRVHETEEKEKENELLRKDNKIKDLQIEKQKNQRTSMFIVILLVFFFFLFIYLRYQEKKKENHLIIENSKLITSQKEQLDQALGKLKEMNINLEKKVEEIKISRERLRMLNKIIRHDLSNDFVVIKSATNIFLKTSDTTVFDEIRKRVDRSLKTIADYREYESFIDSNANLNEFEITELINRIIINYPNIKFDIKGKCKVFADDALDSVFTNLIQNSIIHGNSSKINIIISSHKDLCKIKFIDDGKGIPDEIKDKIFDEGFVYGKHGHTGIGLYIAKQTVENYGGKIYVDDDKSKGAVFVIDLRKAIETK